MIRDLRKLLRELRRLAREARLFLEARRSGSLHQPPAAPTSSAAAGLDKAMDEIAETARLYDEMSRGVAPQVQHRMPVTITGANQWPEAGFNFGGKGDLRKAPIGEAAELLMTSGIPIQIECSGGRILPLGAVHWEIKKDEPAPATPPPIELAPATPAFVETPT